jgi:AraC-like DNA-binding protein
MTLQTWTSDTIHPRDRVDAWRHHLTSQTYRKAVEVHGCSEFRAMIASTRLGDLHLTQVSSVPQRMTVREERSESAYAVSVNIAGGTRIEQHGAVRFLAPGDFVIFRVDRPHRIEFGNDWKQLVLTVPAGLAEAAFPALVELAPLHVAGKDALAAIATRFLRDVASRASGLAGETARELGAQTVGLLASAARHCVDPAGLPPSVDRALRLQRVKQLIDDHLARPELTPSRIAADFGLSERSLHRLFEGTGTSVVAHVRERRLERCATALRDPFQRGRSIAEVAYSSGFTSASVFSRVFRDRYGCSPRAYRDERAPNCR